MKDRLTTMVVGLSSLMLAAAIGLATPAAAEEQTWEMPDLAGESLLDAEDAVTSLSDETPLVLESESAGYPQDIFNEAFWVVCEQSPDAGEEIAADTELSVVVARLPGCEE